MKFAKFSNISVRGKFDDAQVALAAAMEIAIFGRLRNSEFPFGILPISVERVFLSLFSPGNIPLRLSGRIG